jgi:hypothetical protein
MIDPCAACLFDYYECICDCERDYVKQPLEVLSYGGGTQSTAMLVLIKQGKLPKPDLVLHADTGSELPETVQFIEVARQFCADLMIPFAVVRSHRGSLHDDYLKDNSIPIIGSRSCTSNFKIRPQRRYLRQIVGNRRNKVLVNIWLGITTDEAHRASDADVVWTKLKYPLLHDYPIDRNEAIRINTLAGLTVGKSGCFCCPYAGSKHWLNLRDEHPDLFAIALEMENRKLQVRGGKMGLFQEGRLSDLDNFETKDDSRCDSGAGCFL